LDEEELNLQIGHKLHHDYLTRRSTFKWLDEDEEKDGISYKKMLQSVEKVHPRMYVNNEPSKIPLCISTGRLAKRRGDLIYGMDTLGIGVSIYFKLLKSLIYFLLFSLCIIVPLMYLYSCGEKGDHNHTSTLAYLTLGNLGQKT
jgi:hypothetical protein